MKKKTHTTDLAATPFETLLFLFSRFVVCVSISLVDSADVVVGVVAAVICSVCLIKTKFNLHSV